MKYFKVKTNDSRIITTLRSIFSIEELESLLVNPQNNIIHNFVKKILDKDVYDNSTVNKNQVVISDYSSNNMYYIYYNRQKSGISNDLIKIGITGTSKDFIRTVIKYTSSEFRRMFYTLLSNCTRNWFTGTLYVKIHCDYYEFIGHNAHFKIFMARSDFHGEISGPGISIKFDMRKESIESIARKINEVLKTK